MLLTAAYRWLTRCCVLVRWHYKYAKLCDKYINRYAIQSSGHSGACEYFLINLIRMQNYVWALTHTASVTQQIVPILTQLDLTFMKMISWVHYSLALMRYLSCIGRSSYVPQWSIDLHWLVFSGSSMELFMYMLDRRSWYFLTFLAPWTVGTRTFIWAVGEVRRVV